METGLLKFVEYGQWVLLLAVLVWLIRQMLTVINQNTNAIQALGAIVGKICDSVDEHEEHTVEARKAVERIDGRTTDIKDTVTDTNRIVRTMAQIKKGDE